MGGRRRKRGPISTNVPDRDLEIGGFVRARRKANRLTQRGLAADDGGSGPSEVIVGSLPLTLTSYRHVRDSDGSATIDGGETWLAFHASGAAFLAPA